METIRPFLQHLLNSSHSPSNLLKRNLLKEYLQILLLHFIYSQDRTNRFLFYGGSCLKHLFGLPRLSEDLDFVDIQKTTDLSSLAGDLEQHFKKNTDIPVKTVVQKFRVLLKFPILQELNLSQPGETNLLFVKLEIFNQFNDQNYQTQFVPLFKFNKSILVRTFDLPTLMATKLNAILYRQWQKTDKKGKTLISVKGRDYFDLMWYLEKGVSPNLACVKGIRDQQELKNKLLAIVKNVDPKSIELDLEALIEDTSFLRATSQNIKEILAGQIEKKL